MLSLKEKMNKNKKRDRFFDLSLLEFKELEEIYIDGKRHYKTPTNNYYESVTTILSQRLDKSFLEKWVERVGEDAANAIKIQAGIRGTSLHKICEDYILNKENYTSGAMPVNIDSFNKLKPWLDQFIGKVFGSEICLYSDNLRTAGRSDLFAEWDGKISIIDFKTSLKIKKEKWIEGYFIQATTYAMMVEELKGIQVPQIVILIAVDNEEPQKFVLDSYQYRNRVYEVFQVFYPEWN